MISKPIQRIQSFEDIEAIADRNTPIATACSFGVDSGFLLGRLRKLGFKDIHAIYVDLGAPVTPEERQKQKAVAELFGAKFVIIDGRQTFIDEGVVQAILAQAFYFGQFPLSSSLSRHVIAMLIVEYANKEGIQVILHTANRSQNSLRRIDNGIDLVGFTGLYGSPYALSVIPRDEKIDDLAEAGLKFMRKRGMSGDKNVGCNEVEGGEADDPTEFFVPDDEWAWTQHPYTEKTFKLKLGFKNGLPVTVDDQMMPLIDIINMLNTKVGKMDIGCHYGLEHIHHDTEYEAAVLEFHEAPALTVIHEALAHLVSGSLPSGKIIQLRHDQTRWTVEAAAGRWGRDLHKECGIRIAEVMKAVGGSVTFTVAYRKLQPCSIIPEHSICVTNRDQWEIDHVNKITCN